MASEDMIETGESDYELEEVKNSSVAMDGSTISCFWVSYC